jgi:hypothetical protein
MVRRGFRGWEIEYEDGSTIDEEQADWKNISKNNISVLTLHFDGRRWDLSGKQNYIQKKSGSAIPGVQGSFRIESRSIGYYDANTKVMYTVNENTGKMKMEVKELN